jgi:hypothetical protein
VPLCGTPTHENGYESSLSFMSDRAIVDLWRHDKSTHKLTEDIAKITKRNRYVYENKGPAFREPLGI